MHTQVIDWVGQFRTDEDLSVLDIGGRDLNGNTRFLFPNANPYHVLDILPGKGVDIVADAATWDFQGYGPYDLVLCTETFEHAEHWPDIIATAHAILRPGGWFIFTCAGPGRPVHSGIEAVWGSIGNEWYANVSPQEIEAVLKEQGWIDIETHLVGLDTQGKAVKPTRDDPATMVPASAGATGTAEPDRPGEVVVSARLSRTAGS